MVKAEQNRAEQKQGETTANEEAVETNASPGKTQE